MQSAAPDVNTRPAVVLELARHDFGNDEDVIAGYMLGSHAAIEDRVGRRK